MIEPELENEGSLLWEKMTLAKTAYGDIAGALRELDCELCGSCNGWLDIAYWFVRHEVLGSGVGLLTGCVYFCRGCLRADDDVELWGGATAIALQRSEAHAIADGVGGCRFPVFVSVVSPSIRPDNLRCRWLEFL